MNKRKYEGEQTKKNIADKAKTLFSEKGYVVTSIQDICSAAGCSTGNLYYHFKSKEDLFLYLEEQAYSEWWETLDELFARHKTVIEKIHVYANFYSGIERPLYSAEREFINKVGADSEAGRKYRNIVMQSFDKMQKLIADGIASGELKNAGQFDLTFIVTSFFSAMTHYTMYFTNDATRKAMFDKAANLLLHGISARNEG